MTYLTPRVTGSAGVDRPWVGAAVGVGVVPDQQHAGLAARSTMPSCGKSVAPPASTALRNAIAVQLRWPPRLLLVLPVVGCRCGTSRCAAGTPGRGGSAGPAWSRRSTGRSRAGRRSAGSPRARADRPGRSRPNTTCGSPRRSPVSYVDEGCATASIMRHQPGAFARGEKVADGENLGLVGRHAVNVGIGGKPLAHGAAGALERGTVGIAGASELRHRPGA